jgi:hypothetical protein
MSMSRTVHRQDTVTRSTQLTYPVNSLPSRHEPLAPLADAGPTGPAALRGAAKTTPLRFAAPTKPAPTWSGGGGFLYFCDLSWGTWPACRALIPLHLAPPPCICGSFTLEGARSRRAMRCSPPGEVLNTLFMQVSCCLHDRGWRSFVGPFHLS